jgi:hypothetical protein
MAQFCAWANALRVLDARHGALEPFTDLYPKSSPLRGATGLERGALKCTLSVEATLENIAFAQHPELAAKLEEARRLIKPLYAENTLTPEQIAEISERAARLEADAFFFGRRGHGVEDAAFEEDTLYWRSRARAAKRAHELSRSRKRLAAPSITAQDRLFVERRWLRPLTTLLGEMRAAVEQIDASRDADWRRRVKAARSEISKIERRCDGVRASLAEGACAM